MKHKINKNFSQLSLKKQMDMVGKAAKEANKMQRDLEKRYKKQNGKE